LPAFGSPTIATRTGRPLTERSSSCRRRFVSQQLRLRHELDVLVGEVQRRLHVGQQVQQVVAQPLQRPGDAARQLRQRAPQVGVGAGLDHRQDGLRAGQVLLAGEERPQGELAGPGRSGAGGEQVGDQPLDQRR
jgi:hypothetical protein